MKYLLKEYKVNDVREQRRLEVLDSIEYCDLCWYLRDNNVLFYSDENPKYKPMSDVLKNHFKKLKDKSFKYYEPEFVKSFEEKIDQYIHTSMSDSPYELTGINKVVFFDKKNNIYYWGIGINKDNYSYIKTGYYLSKEINIDELYLDSMDELETKVTDYIIHEDLDGFTQLYIKFQDGGEVCLAGDSLVNQNDYFQFYNYGHHEENYFVINNSDSVQKFKDWGNIEITEDEDAYEKFMNKTILSKKAVWNK